jgi:hypothetical protein
MSRRAEKNGIAVLPGWLRSRSHDAVIPVYDEAGNVIEMHKQKGESSTYTTFGSTLTITGERNVP